jgi:translation initiation factor 5A
MSDDEQFESADSGASMTYPVTAGNLKKGGYLNINGRPCKIIEMSSSKTGKHGHAKSNITGVDIFNGRKYEEVAPSSHNLPIPWVKTIQYMLIDIGKDGRVSCMDEEGDTREDLNMPPNEALADVIQKDFAAGKTVSVVVTSAMGHDQILTHKAVDE